MRGAFRWVKTRVLSSTGPMKHGTAEMSAAFKSYMPPMLTLRFLGRRSEGEIR
jgi:hypothetical protein